MAPFFVKLRFLPFNDARLDIMLLAAGILLFLAGPGKPAIDATWPEGDAMVERRA